MFQPNLAVPDKYWFSSNRKIQLFRQSLYDALNHENYNLVITGTGPLNNRWIHFERYIEIDTTGVSGEGTLTFEVQNENCTVLRSRTVNYCVTGLPTNPSTALNVMLVGDSLVDRGDLPSELERLVTMTTGGSGTLPRGYGLTNVNFIGSRTNSTGRDEGYAGRNWEFFTPDGNEGSAIGPFNPSFSQHLIENDLPVPDHIYFMLTWNDFPETPVKSLADWDFRIARAKEVIDAIHSDFPNITFTIIGIQQANAFQGSVRLDYWHYQRGTTLLNQAYQILANDPEYSGFVDFIDTATRVDSECASTTDKPKNCRTTEIEKVGNDFVHPSRRVGSYQQADVVCDHLIGKLLQ